MVERIAAPAPNFVEQCICIACNKCKEEVMQTEARRNGAPRLNTEYTKYEVDSRRCDLGVGDTVTPETVIGWHYRDGQPVKTGYHGRVATVFFNPMHDSLMILITSSMLNNS